jgi:hypothetical protein
VAGIAHLAADITAAEAIRPAFAGIRHGAPSRGGHRPGPDRGLGRDPGRDDARHPQCLRSGAPGPGGEAGVVFFSSGGGSAQLGAGAGLSFRHFDEWAGFPRSPPPGRWRGRIGPCARATPTRWANFSAKTSGRYYADKYGLSSLVVRLGAVLPEDRPQVRRQFPGFLSQADCVSPDRQMPERPRRAQVRDLFRHLGKCLALARHRPDETGCSAGSRRETRPSCPWHRPRPAVCLLPRLSDHLGR